MIGVRSLAPVPAVDWCVMSVQPQPWPEPSWEVARAVLAMYGGRRAPLPVVIRDELGELFADRQFAVGFGVRGRPGWSPGRLAMITVLQMVENLTDAQAAEAVRLRLDWKYALGLDLGDAGFDASVLCEFRARVIEHGLEERALDLLVAALVDKGLLKAGGRQRTDATHVLAGVRDLNRLELAGESVRACLEAIAAAEPDWLAAVIDVPDWVSRYGARVDSWRLPASKTKRWQLADAYGRDGFALLAAVYDPAAPGRLATLPVVDVLRRVLLQNYVVTTDRSGREVIKMREAEGDGLPPGRYRVLSPYDIDARYGGKRDLVWKGYKLHISETCDAQATEPGSLPQSPPNLVIHVATTNAAVADASMLDVIHQGMARRRVLPGEHLVDAGYPSADLLTCSLTEYGIALIAPMRANCSRQTRAGDGFDRTAFTVDWDIRQVTCPQGHTNTSWSQADQRGTDTIVVKFPARVCQQCPVKARCTTSDHGRQLSLRPRQVQQALDDARTEQATPAWKARYAQRAGIEATIAQSVKVTDTRRARYRGLAKTRLEHVYKAVALNFIRLDAWYNGVPLNPAHTSHLSRLEHALAA